VGRGADNFLRVLTDEALFRATGAPLVRGNQLRILRDGEENYPEWMAAIEGARKTIHLEMYIIHNDNTGRRFRDLLAAKAREGVKVRVLYDWFGSLRLFQGRMWKVLREAGGEVRPANPPKLDSLLGWASRDHRKLLTIDGSQAFISGLCIGDAWVGDPARGVAPWRDTGVAMVGPAVADAEAAFAAAWKLAGGSLPALPRREDFPEAGNVSCRIVPASPETAGLYRLDLLLAATVQKTLWLTDAYFIGTSAYLQALRSAAQSGVDVRLLVPHGSDIQWIANLSRTMYRSLLLAGVRVFEWNGPMIHAKTAVADGRFARIGSTNLNIASWLRNWELDVIIENERLAGEAGQMFLEDLSKATEIVITPRNKVRLTQPCPPRRRKKLATGSGKHMLSGMVRVGSALDAAVTGHRSLGETESSPPLFSISGILLALALLTIFFPKVIAYPAAFVLGWAGILLLGKGLRLRISRKNRMKAQTKK
jgi:cardiolipin synthase A/B